jgi:hypothetical protein
MEEIKDLSLELFEELDSQYDEKKEIIVKVKTLNGEMDTKLEIDKYFHPKKIEECVKELLKKIDYAKIYLNKEEDDKQLYQIWLILLIIKHFSSLEIPNEFKKQLAVLEKLIEHNLVFQIFAEFEVSEIHKVMNEMDRVTQILMVKLDALEPAFEEVEKNFPNLSKKE